MKFFVSAASAAALFAALASASNTLLNPKEGEVVPCGKPYLMKWEADTPGPVTLTLRKGDSKNLDTVYDIVMLEYNWGNYTWDVPADTPSGKDYAFQIKWGKNPGPDDVNYTYQFEISGGEEGSDDEASTTESASATETETATATESEYPTETTDAETETQTETETEPTTTKGSGNSTETEVPSGSNTTTKVTKTPTGPTATPDTKDEDNSAGVFGASVSMALAVAVAAAALL